MTSNIEIINLSSALSSALPIWPLVFGSFLCLIVDMIWPKKIPQIVYGIGLFSLLMSLYFCMIEWANYNISNTNDLLIMDLKGIFLMGIIVIAGIITLLNALGYLSLHNNFTAEFTSLLLFCITGMIFLFVSNHLIVNFVGLELMSLSLYILIGTQKKSIKAQEAAMKYFILGSLASAILLFGIALLFGIFKTMDLSLISFSITSPELLNVKNIAMTLLITGVIFKIGLVPFHFWVPDVYEGAPAPITGFMATGVKVAAIGFALRIFTHFNLLTGEKLQSLFYVIIIATFILGNLLALVQNNLKRMLAYSSISHAGFILFGIIACTVKGQYIQDSTHIVLFYLISYVFMTLGAFAFLSLLIHKKSEADDVSDLTGLGHTHPILASLFTLFMLSLIGIPGTVGFIAKYNVLLIGIQNEHIVLSVIAVIASVVSVYYYLKPSVYLFLKPKTSRGTPLNTLPLTLCISLTLCAFFVLYFGLMPDILIKLTKLATIH